MRGPTKRTLIRAVAATPVILAALAGPAVAQVQVTPNFSVTPSKTITPWVYQMAFGALIIGVIAVLGILVSYLRFAPAFFGRRSEPAKLPPGARPQLLTRPVQPPVATRPAVAPPASPQAAPASAAVAVAERPAPAPSPGAEAAASATTTPTAGPESEPATQADAVGAAEAAAPEPRPSAKTAEEVGAPPEAEAPAAEAPAAEAPAAEAPAPASHGAQLDQETFDRVLEEQLGKGVDRRVAEGRARAAAVVAARKKAQG